MKIFKKTNLLITGGTGSFGNQVLKSLLRFDFNEIRILAETKKARRYEAIDK